MLRFKGIFTAAALAALVAIPLLAYVDPFGGWDQQFGGKYITPDGYVLLSIDETGKVAGYFERDGSFGEISGRFDGRTFRGHWMQAESKIVCDRELHGYESWGRMELTFDTPQGFSGKLGACEATPANKWSGRR